MASRCAISSTSRIWSTWSSASCSIRETWDGRTVNVGGGRECSLSLRETTEICQRLTGNEVPIDAGGGDAPGGRPDIPLRLHEALRPGRVAAAAQRRAGAGRHPRLDRRRRGAHRPGARNRHPELEGATERMPVAIITGAGGLIGSEAVDHFIGEGFDVVGIENDMRARFFGPESSTSHVTQRLVEAYPSQFRWENADIRDAGGDRPHLRRARRQDRARRPHRRAALARLGRERAADRLRRQRQRHPQPARGGPRPLPRRALRLLLDQQGLRRHAQPPAAAEPGEAARSCRRTTPTTRASTPRCRSTPRTHSLFGVSKAAADLLVQEYGRYFDMPTGRLPRRLPDRARSTPAPSCTASSPT